MIFIAYLIKLYLATVTKIVFYALCPKLSVLYLINFCIWWKVRVTVVFSPFGDSTSGVLSSFFLQKVIFFPIELP